MTVGTAATAATLFSVRGSITEIQTLTVYATTAYFGSDSVVNTTSLSPGQGQGSNDTNFAGGGAHGGSAGGVGADVCNAPYDSYLTPRLPGSQGGTSPAFSSLLLPFITL